MVKVSVLLKNERDIDTRSGLDFIIAIDERQMQRPGDIASNG